MADLSAEIHAARDRAIRKVEELHDDYVRTNQLWLELLVRERYGEKPPTFHNVKTGSAVSVWTEWLSLSRESRRRLRIRTFKDLCAQVELFVADLLRAWLTEFPAAVTAKSITLGEVLAGNDLPDLKSRAIVEAVEGTILDKLKAKPAAWFGYLRTHLGCRRTTGEIEHFAERKAARDVLEHHDGVVDDGYVEKAGNAAVFTLGDHFEPDDAAIDSLYDFVRSLITAIADDADRQYQSLPKVSTS
jgi:hypothetical protein